VDLEPGSNPESFRIPDGDKEAPREELDATKERILGDDELRALLEEYGEDGWEDHDGQALVNTLYTVCLNYVGVDPDDLLAAKGILD